MIIENAALEVKNILKYDQLEVLHVNSTQEVLKCSTRSVTSLCVLGSVSIHFLCQYLTIDFRFPYSSFRLSFCDRSWTDKRSPVINLLIPLGWGKVIETRSCMGLLNGEEIIPKTSRLIVKKNWKLAASRQLISRF